MNNDGTIKAYFTYSRYFKPSQYEPGYTNYYFKGDGVYLQHGGIVTNGATAGAKAQIGAAVYGVDVVGAAGTVRNFGFIYGENNQGVTCTGVRLGAGGQVTNGSAADPGATIEGDIGVIVAGVGTVTNFGVIAGSGVAAVEFSSAADTLVVEAGSTIHGAVNGADGTLDLASGTGNISVIPYSTVTLAGPTPTTFSGFGTVEVGSGAQFTLTGLGQIRDEAIDTLDLEGVLVVTGELDTGSKTVGAGTLSLQGGTADFLAGASLSVSHVTVAGTSTVDVGGNLAYAGAWTQSAGSLSVGTGDQATFGGAADSFAGSFSGAGEVELSAVTATIGSGGLSLTGSGEVVLSDSASSGLVGASAATVLTNVGEFIEGAGKLGGGKLTLVNQSAGYVESLGANVLTIDTGTSTIANAGVIEAVGAGGLTIVSAVANTGRLIAYSSLLTIDGAVTGAGYGQIDTGRLKIAATATFNQNVTFVGAGGTLELAHGQTYTGTLSGFSATGETSLDLDDIDFAVGTTKATFSGTSTGGVLTVTDGTHTGKIKLTGDYLNSTFTTGPGAGGVGTRIIDTRPISWTRQVSGAFATVANWTGGLSPGAANEALLDAPGSTAYIVIAGTSETVASVQIASTARLAITGGVFTITNGTGAGSNAGQLSVTQNGTLDVGGVFANAKVFYVENNGVVKVAAGGLTLTGSGTLYLADNTLEGVTSGATLTTSNFIYGAGQLGAGQMALINQAAGVVESYGSSPLTVDTGADTITNAGVFLALGAGGMTIASAVANSGHFAVNGGSMTVMGAVTGKGYGEVVRGTLDFVGTFNENVIFTSGSTGTLELGDSLGYTAGRIQGLSTTGANALDLADITFTSGVTKATFSGSSTSGVLTVTDGTHTARIGLIGDYLGSTFTTSLGAGGVGTRIVDPVPRHTILPAHAFVQAMAGLGAAGSGALEDAGAMPDPGRHLLVAPAQSTA